MTAATAEEREHVGPYRVIKAIGAGGSARIDLARIDRAYGFQRHVVIKRPLEHLRKNPKVAASLRREARIGGQLRHPCATPTSSRSSMQGSTTATTTSPWNTSTAPRCGP
jgi:serine/threonine protein kinase